MKLVKVLINNIGVLDYLICDSKAIIGNIVLAPYRTKEKLGIILATPEKSDLEFHKLKIIEKHSSLQIKNSNLEFLEWVSKYYLSNFGLVAKLMIPDYISKFIAKTQFQNESNIALNLNSQNVKIFNNIDDSGKSVNQFTPPSFSEEQVFAVEEINKLLLNEPRSILIDGVTGSGKTEVFLSAAAKTLELDPKAQVLIMLPEISLSPQITNRIFKRFNKEPVVWHSAISNKTKKSAYFSILNGDAQLVLGARSALFLPYKNLKMIIVDEEHEQIYKQEDGVTYQARDMAIMRAKLENIPVILASASPSIESLENSNQGKYHKINLTKRYNDIKLPEIEIVDLKNIRPKNNNYISPILIEALAKNLEENKQSLLFLNRKGYSPILICKECGSKVSCKNCSASMVYHKSSKKLKCHQCGHESAIGKKCYNCDAPADRLTACGPGVEKILEEVESLFPQSKTITLTQESFHDLNKAKEILSRIENNEYNIIIGTQIIAKGHHFPYLNLVGIIDADTGIISGDLRALEKNFQLLQQVSGRAGREIENSKIFLQTYNPTHPMIAALASYNRDRFFAEEIKNRKLSFMPPFARLASVIFSAKSETKLNEFAKQIIKAAPTSKDIKIFGPAPAIIYKLRGRFRQRILLKSAKNINLQKYISDWLNLVKIPTYINLKIDIDPYSFF